MTAPVPVLQMTGLTKTFGGSHALGQVDFSVDGGEIRALIGHNGSGKSTLIKILSGFHTPDGGEIRLHGEAVETPISAGTLRRHRVSFLHQDLSLVPTLSIVENLRAGRLQARGGRIRWKSERTRARKLLAEYGLDVDPAIKVARLSQTQQTILGMVRALDTLADDVAGADSGLVVLDEPTSALPASEIDELFAAIRVARDAGHSIVLVTHHLDEVFAVADTVTVLRGGRLAATTPVADVDEAELIRTMIGGELDALEETPAAERRDPVMSCHGLTGEVCRDVQLDVAPGEILGLTGLLGAGHEEIPYLLFGATPARGGVVVVDGAELRRRAPAVARDAGLALLPSDRQRDSGIMAATVAENASLPSLGALRRAWGLDTRAEMTAVQALLERFDVRPAKPGLRLGALSGGNQQKVLLGRWIEQDPKLLLLDEPSNGIDVAARRAIFEILQEAAVNGMAVIVASSQYEDIAAICTRAVVFSRGRVVGELNGSQVTADNLLAACYRAEAA
jgi:ribose transport system ATP-binding protein